MAVEATVDSEELVAKIEARIADVLHTLDAAEARCLGLVHGAGTRQEKLGILGVSDLITRAGDELRAIRTLRAGDELRDMLALQAAE